MKPVDQLIVPDRQSAHGDCMRACIASILELAASEVPDFYDYPGSDGTLGNQRLQQWLAARGLGYTEMPLRADCLEQFAQHFLGGYHVLIGRAGLAEHAVVAYQGRVVHDPHTGRNGIEPLIERTASGDAPYYIVGVLRLIGGAPPCQALEQQAATAAY